MSDQTKKTKLCQDLKHPVTLKSLYKRIHSDANDLQAPYFEEGDTCNLLNQSLKSDFQILADCIEYLENQLKIPSPDQKHRRRFRNHNPKYIEGCQWSEISFYDKIQSDESDEEISEDSGSTSHRRPAKSKSAPSTKLTGESSRDESSKASKYSSGSYQPGTD